MAGCGMSTTPKNDQLAVFLTAREAVPVEPRHRALKVPICSRFSRCWIGATQVYNEAQAARAWSRLLVLFEFALA